MGVGVWVLLTCTVRAVAKFRTTHLEMGITQPIEEVVMALMSPVCVCVCVCVCVRACVFVGHALISNNKMSCLQLLETNYKSTHFLNHHCSMSSSLSATKS